MSEVGDFSEYEPTDEPERMGDGATFDLSGITPQDVPPVAPLDEPIVPDHTASEDASKNPFERVRAAREQREAERERKRKDKPKKPAPPRTGKGAPGALVKPLTSVYTSIGLALAPFDQPCAFAVMSNAEQCAVSLDALAQRNDSVKRALLAITETSAWGAVLAAHLPLLLVVVAHHGGQEMRDRVGPLAAMMNQDAQQMHDEHAGEDPAA